MNENGTILKNTHWCDQQFDLQKRKKKKHPSKDKWETCKGVLLALRWEWLRNLDSFAIREIKTHNTKKTTTKPYKTGKWKEHNTLHKLTVYLARVCVCVWVCVCAYDSTGSTQSAGHTYFSIFLHFGIFHWVRIGQKRLGWEYSKDERTCSVLLRGTWVFDKQRRRKKLYTPPQDKRCS